MFVIILRVAWFCGLSGMSKVFVTVLCWLGFALCNTAFAKVVYLYNSPLDIKRYYTTQIVIERDNLYSELIYFDSEQVILSHQSALLVPLNVPCLDNTAIHNANLGVAYRYQVTDRQVNYCNASSIDFPVLAKAHSVISIEPGVMVLKVHSDLPADVMLRGNQLFDRLFQLTSLPLFSAQFPELMLQLQRNKQLIVSEGEHTFQLLLLSKRI